MKNIFFELKILFSVFNITVTTSTREDVAFRSIVVFGAESTYYTVDSLMKLKDDEVA